MDAADERRAVDQVIEHLSARLPQQPAERVCAIDEQAHHQLDGTPIRTFVPVLVKREARERLGRLLPS